MNRGEEQYQKGDVNDLSCEKSSWLAKVGVCAIRFYQRFISPLLGSNCRFSPTCSQYTLEAMTKYGFFKGGIMGMWRILRCNPFCKGGKDPVP